MLQQVMTAPGVIEFNEVPVPEVKPGQVLVKIQKIGIDVYKRQEQNLPAFLCTCSLLQ